MKVTEKLIRIFWIRGFSGFLTFGIVSGPYAFCKSFNCLNQDLQDFRMNRILAA